MFSNEQLSTPEHPSRPAQLPLPIHTYYEMEQIAGHTTQKIKAVVPQRDPHKVAAINKAYDAVDRYNSAYEHKYRAEKAQREVEIKARNAELAAQHKVVIQERPKTHLETYGYAGIDQSTIDAFGSLNLDLGTMTKADRQKIYEFLGPQYSALPIVEAVQVAKVMCLDRAADLKDEYGPRPVAYKDIPVRTPDSVWAQKQQPKEEPKKSWLSRAASKVGSALKKLW